MKADQPDKVDLRSHNVMEDKKQELLRLFPEILTEGEKIDFERLKLVLGEMVDAGKERYGMNWPGKADCFKAIQAPSVATLVPCHEDSINFDITENLMIEGDNLEVLKLLQKSHLGKIKLIYIDPPYNTGNEFIYPDDYSESLQTYLEYTGQVDPEGKKFSTNTEADGRFHSKWLNMMYPRLYLARNLLSDDGAIFVSIDDNELAGLRNLMNEIFGEDNFIATIIWQKVYSPKNSAQFLSEDHDYIVLYAKNSELWRPSLLPRSDEANARYENIDNDPRGPWKPSDLTARNYYSKGLYEVTSPSGKKFTSGMGRYWRQSYESFKQLEADDRVWWGPKKDATPSQKRFLNEVQQGMVPQTLWSYADVGHTQEAKKELIEFVEFHHNENVLNSVKPTRLLQRILQISTRPDSHDIVLDFFGGSATTAHAVLKQNKQDGGTRQFIVVQLPEKLPTPEPKLQTIFDIGLERVRGALRGLSNEQDNLFKDGAKPDHGFRVFRLTESNFKVWDTLVDHDPKIIEEQLELHVQHIREGRTTDEIFYEILLKSGFPLSTRVETIALQGKTVYSVSSGALLVCLEKELTLELIRGMVKLNPERVVCLDAGFAANDQLKANAVQIFKTKGITSFKTI